MPDVDTLDFRALDLATRLELGVRSPAPFFVTGEDALRISAICSLADRTVTVSGRFLRLDGTITPFLEVLIPTSNRVITSKVVPLGDGWILNLTVNTGAATCNIGQCWARVQVIRGLASSGIVLGTLVSGYVTSTQSIAFPQNRARGTLDGPGVIRSITGTDPAAGADISETVPTGARWRLLSFLAVLTTDATVANRAPQLLIDDGTNRIYVADPPALQAASTGVAYVAAVGVTRLAAVYDRAVWAFPTDMPMLAGYRVRTLTGSLQAGDNWGAPQLLVEEWLEGD